MTKEDAKELANITETVENYRLRTIIGGKTTEKCHIFVTPTEKVFVFDNTREITRLKEWDEKSKWFYAIKS